LAGSIEVDVGWRKELAIETVLPAINDGFRGRDLHCASIERAIACNFGVRWGFLNTNDKIGYAGLYTASVVAGRRLSGGYCLIDLNTRSPLGIREIGDPVTRHPLSCRVPRPQSY
jgi:hypothetical protein